MTPILMGPSPWFLSDRHHQSLGGLQKDGRGPQYLPTLRRYPISQPWAWKGTGRSPRAQGRSWACPFLPPSLATDCDPGAMRSLARTPTALLFLQPPPGLSVSAASFVSPLGQGNTDVTKRHEVPASRAQTSYCQQVDKKQGGYRVG